jgi:hypothetical protein
MKTKIISSLIHTVLLATVCVCLPVDIYPCGYSIPVMAGDTEYDYEEDWRILESVLTTLWEGSREEKLTILIDEVYCFDILEDVSSDDESRSVEALESLTALLVAEKDEWVLDRLLVELVDADLEELIPFFRTAIEHSSLNVRRRAMEFFSWNEDPVTVPLLEKLWRREMHAHVRPVLLEALNWNESVKYLDDYIELIESDDPVLAIEAISGVIEFRPRSAHDQLVECARDCMPVVRRQALATLSVWPSSESAAAAVIDATYEPQFRCSTLNWLRKFTVPAARDRLLEVAADTRLDADRRRSAVDALWSIDTAYVFSVLDKILDEPEDESTQVLKAVAELLRNIKSGIPFSFERIERVTTGAQNGCQEALAEVSEDTRYVAPAADMNTLRCWDGPRVAMNPEPPPRLVEGLQVEIDDVFLEGDDVWVQVTTESGECWLREADLQQEAESAGATLSKLDQQFSSEFDLPVADLERPVMAGLLDAGFLRVIDPGEVWTGLAVQLDPEDRDDVATWVELIQPDTTGVGEIIMNLTDTLLEMYPDD